MVCQCGSAGCTLMGKTADFTVIETRIINALYEERLKVIVKAAVCSRRAVSLHTNGKMEVRKRGSVDGKRCTCNSHNRSLEKIVEWRCGRKLNQEYGGDSNQRHQWGLTWAKDRTARLLCGPTSSSHMKDNFTFNVDIKVPEPGGRVQMHRSLSPSLRSSVKWWLVSWNRWFHFPAGLGNCPNCSKYQYLMEGLWYLSASLASKLLKPLRESLNYCEEEDAKH